MYKKLRDLKYNVISNKYTRSLQNIVTLSMRYSSLMDNETVHSVIYLWTASVEDAKTGKMELFNGRTWEDFRVFINELSIAAKLDCACPFDDSIRNFMANSVKKRTDIRIYNHSLSQTFQFLRNAFDDDKFGYKNHVFARDVRKPMYAWINENNTAIRFIDTSKLRPCTLTEWANDEMLPVNMIEETFDSTIKTPITPLSDEEIKCVYNDNLIVAYGIKKYRDKYSTLENIPLTQAGEVRRECKAVVSNTWIANCKNVLKSYDFETYQDLCRVFLGGSIHVNSNYKDRLLSNIKSFDIGSGYPGILTTRRFPVSPWEDTNKYDDPNYFYYYKVQFKNVHCKLFNTFWPVAKIVSSEGLAHDDFNLQSARSVILYITDIDMNIFKQVYSYSEMTILKARRSKAAYLPKGLIELILSHYGKKTTLKGTDRVSEYVHEKVSTNCFYGVFVTRNITDDVYFNENGWQVDELDEAKFIKKRDEEAKKDIFTIYQIGPWVTAYCREMLWSAIIRLDKKVVYFDTDCVKGNFTDEDEKIFSIINNVTHSLIMRASEHYEIDPAAYMPMNRPIGFFEKEHTAIEFKTIGSKRYAALYDSGIETVISGLSKEAGASKIHHVDELDESLIWSPDESGRYTFYYIDAKNPYVWTDRFGEKYENKEEYGIAKIPSSFEFGTKDEVKTIKSVLSGGRPAEYFNRTKVFRDL